MSAVSIAVQIQPQHADYSAIRDTVTEAEGRGVDIVYNWDHFFPLTGDPDGKHFECWTMLGAWAEQTTRVEIGALVTCNSYRNPHLLADMARTVDHISNGRLILGIGSGWFERDYDEYGYEFGTAGSRLDILSDALPAIEERWGKLNPPPTRKIPVMIGGGGEKKTLRMVAQHADIWHTFGGIETLTRKTAVLERWCERVGRDSTEIERSVGVSPRAGREVGGRGAIVNTADVAATAEPYFDLGVRQFTLGISGQNYDLDFLDEWLTWRDEKNA